MNVDSSPTISIFTESTKNICTCSAISIFLILLFILTPLRHFFHLSLWMKISIMILLTYTLYLNQKQIHLLTEAKQFSVSESVKSQLTINIVSSYVFTLFIGLLLFFTGKYFF